MGLKEVIEAWQGVPIKELLRRMYIDENKSQAQIANELHISQQNVSIWMEKYGIVKNNNLFTKEKFYRHRKVRLKDDDQFIGRKRKS